MFILMFAMVLLKGRKNIMCFLGNNLYLQEVSIVTMYGPYQFTQCPLSHFLQSSRHSFTTGYRVVHVWTY